MNAVTAHADGCTVTFKVVPRASKSEFAGREEAWIKVRLQAPPVDGKANDALIAFLADRFKVPRRDIVLVAGQTSRLKIVRLTGVPAERFDGIS